ncbi:helix-turn-helix domain-containing protein [uncultured Jatrophihabitans sp.]|uniref:helix-turn-helix domain-containing protein n=1 Tax=uncultured Jatrophihabitans sp. TaxID=1610747 RepID=UPI0035CBFDAC
MTATDRDAKLAAAGQHIAQALSLIFEASGTGQTVMVTSQPPPRMSWADALASDDPIYLDTEEVAERFRMSAAAVRGMRSQGIGPMGVKFGRRVMYPVAEVDRWEREHYEQAQRDHDRNGGRAPAATSRPVGKRS